MTPWHLPCPSPFLTPPDFPPTRTLLSVIPSILLSLHSLPLIHCPSPSSPISFPHFPERPSPRAPILHLFLPVPYSSLQYHHQQQQSLLSSIYFVTRSCGRHTRGSPRLRAGQRDLDGPHGGRRRHLADCPVPPWNDVCGRPHLRVRRLRRARFFERNRVKCAETQRACNLKSCADL
jgi:hypothetical protein